MVGWMTYPCSYIAFKSRSQENSYTGYLLIKRFTDAILYSVFFTGGGGHDYRNGYIVFLVYCKIR